MAYRLTDFSDIYTAVAEELKIQLTDTTSLNRIKRAINMMYLDEIVPAARWWWLYGNTALTHSAYYASGTATVTPTNTGVTISVAPAVTQGESGSFKNYLFSVDSDNEIYKISAHTALSTSITLDRPYNGTLASSTARYKIWTDELPLPTDLRETVEVYHDHNRSPLTARGLQKFREIAADGHKDEGRPHSYCTYDFRDPSTGDGETEGDRFRVLKLWPSISQYSTIVKVDYTKEATALDVAGDEPLLPLEDRIVLFYGALSLTWGSIGRNPEEAARNRALFESKLARMMGKVEDSHDKPRLEPESTYVSAKRGPRISSISRRALSGVTGGQSSYNAPNYLKNVTIEGATLTANVTATAGVTVDGRDISVDGAALDAHIPLSASVHGVVGNVVGTTDTQSLSAKSIDGDLNTITNIADSGIKVGAAIARNKLASGTASVIVVNDGSGVMTDSSITTTELGFLDDTAGLASVVLTDNTSAATAALTFAHASFDTVSLTYSISRGSANKETGIINLATDGTNAAIAQGAAASLGTLGVVFTADVSGADMRLLYTTTSTGTNATLKYKLHKWLS